MKHLPIPLLAILLVPAVASGQSVPTVTKEGKEALEKLMGACVNDRALTLGKKADGTEIPVVNEAKLKATAAAHRGLLTPALRDAVVAHWFRTDVDQKPVYAAFLRAYAAEKKKDERALAFAALFTATAKRERKLSAAVPHYEEAVRHFNAVGEAAWQAICLNDIGLTYQNLADYPRAWDYLQQAPRPVAGGSRRTSPRHCQ
jgi:hypothetical protein